MASRPVATPELYTGEGPVDAWLDHFESVATLNGWDDKQKAQWLAVRLVGRAQVAYKRLSEGTRSSYATAKEALLRRFEPESRRDLYAAEFQVRAKQPTEDWASFADDIKTLADRAFPDLPDAARERLAIDRLLGQISDPQLAFGVRQKRPKTVDEAVAATLELHSHLQLANRSSGPTILIPESNASVAAIGPSPQEDSTSELLRELIARMDKLETELSQHQPVYPTPPSRQRQSPRDRSSFQTRGRGRGPVVCYRCGQVGHFARGCASSRQSAMQQHRQDQHQGN